MSSLLRWLIWSAVLVVGLSVTLDWQDELRKLQPERISLERIRQREDSGLLSIDWRQELERSREAQRAWKDRLPEVTQMGIFRAEAMEAMADLCKQLEANCQISALGESASYQSARRSNTSGSSTSGGGNAVNIPGLVSTSVRLIVSLNGGKLAQLLNEIERGNILRKIDKFSVRSGQADMVVRTFAVQNQSAVGLTAASEVKR